MIRFSKNESLLLRLLYTNPGREFYIHEIGRALGKKPGVFQRTLNNLEKSGLVVSQYRANARYFRVNTGHPLHKDIKNIVFKTVGVTGSLKEVLESIGLIDFAFLYGSFAKGTENPVSDIDLMIVGSPDEAKLLRRFSSLERSLGREINYRLYTSIDFVRDARKREPFLVHILEDRIVVLIGSEDELRKMASGSVG